MSQPTTKPKNSERTPPFFGQARSLVFLTLEAAMLLLLAG